MEERGGGIATATRPAEAAPASPVAGTGEAGRARPPGDARARKFRQAAFVYLHVGILYLVAVWVIHGQGLLPAERGPLWAWFLFGVAIVAIVFLALWRWQSAWAARIVWALHALRLPALIQGAFFPDPASAVPASFYLTALVVVLVNLWMLARAGWDL